MIHYTAAHMISDTLCNMKKLQKSNIENVASLGCHIHLCKRKNIFDKIFINEEQYNIR